MKSKGTSFVPFDAKVDTISNGSSPIQEVSAMNNLKDKERETVNLNSQIHPSFTYQIDHGEEGIEHLREMTIDRREKNKKVTTFHK
jgi:hypothetical protein